MSSEKKKSSKTTNSTSPPYEIPVHNLFAKETKLFLFSKLPTLDQIFNKYVNLFHLEEEEDLDLDDLILDIKYFYKNLWFTIDTEKDVQTFLHLQKQYCTTNPKEEIEINSENNLPCLCLVINHYILNNEEEEEEEQEEVPVRREETKKEQKGSKKNNLESCRHSLVNILKELNYNFPIPTISSKGFSIPSLLGAEFIEQIENAKGKIMELEQVYSTLHSRLKRRGRRHKGELKLEMDRLLMCGWIWNSIKTLLINQNNLLPIKEQKLPQILYYEYLKEQIVLLKKPEEKSKDKPKSFSSSENIIQIQKQQLLSQEQKYKEIYSLLSERDEEERLLLLFIKYPFLYEIIGMEQEELVFNRSWFLKYLKGNILSKVCEDISFLQPQEEDNNKEEQEVELSPFPQRDSSLQEIILLPPQVEEEEEEEEKSPVPKKKKKKDRRKSQSNCSSNKKKKTKNKN